MNTITPTDLDDLDQIAPDDYISPQPLKRIRDHHHAVARMIAMGRRSGEISAATGLCLSRISILKRDVLFQRLVETYRHKYSEIVDEIFADVVKKKMLLLANALDTLNENYENDEVDHDQARQDATFAHDSLYGKFSQNVNVSADLTDGIAAEMEARRKHILEMSEQIAADTTLALPVAKPES
jgi:hypothetical protein